MDNVTNLLEQYHRSGKTHIIITGDRGSGKTTLFRKIIPLLGNGEELPGITTWAVRSEAVYMQKNGTGDKVAIGQFDPSITGQENRMKPVSAGFLEYGINKLQELMQEKEAWVTVDEIGYLECSCIEYQEKILELFKKKKLLCVVRKQNVEFLTKICGREDVFLIDLGNRNF